MDKPIKGWKLVTPIEINENGSEHQKNIKSHNRISLQSYDREEFLNQHTKIYCKRNSLINTIVLNLGHLVCQK